MDKSAERHVKEGRPDCVNTQVRALQDVRNFDAEKEWDMAGSMLGRLRRSSHVPKQNLGPLDYHRSV